MKRLKASFTIEAAYIFPIIFFTLAFVFNYARTERDLTLSRFVLRESASRAAHLEPTYDPDGPDADDITAAMGTRFAGVDQLATDDTGASRSLFSGSAWFEGSGLSLSEDALLAAASRYELRHGGVSGRTASQFINEIAGGDAGT